MNRAGAGRCAHDGGSASFEARCRLEAVWSLGFAEAGARRSLRVTADHSELSDDHWLAYRDQLIDVA